VEGPYFWLGLLLGICLMVLWRQMPKKRAGLKEQIESLAADPVKEETKDHEKIKIQQQRQEEGPVIGLLQIDNFSEMIQEVEDEKRPVLQAEIDKVLTEWAIKIEGLIKKYAEDRYLLVMSQEALRECQKNRFDIMDRLREIQLGNKIPISLSMGVGAGEEPITDTSRLAGLGLELALGRGGDQVVVKWPDKVLFYGGKTNVIEKKTKVRARVVAYTLRQYIQQATQVIVMGHESSDLDSAGASLGVAKVAMDYGKPVRIVLDNSAGTLDKLWQVIGDYPEYSGRLSSGKEALLHADKDTLLVICDTNKPSLLIEPRLLDKAGRKILIDHHRRGEEFISKTELIYMEPYASSTCELVTEVIQYIGEEVSLDPLAASALLAGMMVDSKNFVFQTGVRTFEAAAFLRRVGAEPGLVRKFLEDNYEMVLVRAQVLQNSEIVFSNIVVGYLDYVVPHNSIIAAEAADMLLSIEGIKASFVLYVTNDGVNISGRSSGDINVQVLLEELGGGGHLAVAGVQLKGLNIAEAKDKLMAVLKTYLEENN
jgi:c-di-AMP phosphodiesterase-like protein